MSHSESLEGFANALAILELKSAGLAAICRHLPKFADERIQTACVMMDGGKLSLRVCPRFWNGLDVEGKTFILAHEAIHVAFCHMVRGKHFHQSVMNVAADAVTNDMLQDVYKMSPPSSLAGKIITGELVGACWDDSMESIIAKLNTNICTMILKEKTWASDHRHYEVDDMSQAVEKLIGSLPENARKDLKWTNGGTAAETRILRNKSMTAAKKLLDHLRRGRHGLGERQTYSWTKEPRRSSDNLLIPCLEESKNKSKCRINMYLDSSGSMHFLEEQLLGCGRELQHRGVECDLFWFDTVVYKIGARRQTYVGGGGTDFGAVVKHAEEQKNVDLNLVITDGMAASVRVKNPSGWLWLITEGGSGAALRGMPQKPVSWAFQQKICSAHLFREPAPREF